MSGDKYIIIQSRGRIYLKLIQMIILEKENDVKNLKRWDSRISREELDFVSNSADLDYEKIEKITTKWNRLVDNHIEQLDKKIDLIIK